MQILTLLLAIQGICLSRQTYFLGDFNILVQIMPAVIYKSNICIQGGLYIRTNSLNVEHIVQPCELW